MSFFYCALLGNMVIAFGTVPIRPSASTVYVPFAGVDALPPPPPPQALKFKVMNTEKEKRINLFISHLIKPINLIVI